MPDRKRKRIAVVFSEQVYPGKLGGTHLLMNLTKALGKMGYRVKVFSLGPEQKRIHAGAYVEDVLRSPVSTNSRSAWVRSLDYLMLLLATRQYSYHNINYNKELDRAVAEFDPDYVISLGRILTDFLLRYRGDHPSVRAMTVTDDFRVVDNSLEIRREAAESSPAPLRAAVGLMSRRFRSFSWDVYSRMVEGLDAVAYLTQEDLAFASRRFPRMRPKFHVLPTVACPPDEVLARPAHPAGRRIRHILFIGNRRHEPNAQAMELIERTIAPKLPGKQFIILGSGTEARRSGNVRYTGFVPDREKLQLIDSADLCIAPLLRGSGIKVKVLEYFMRCRPVLGTAVAFEGYPVRNGVHAIIENNPERYARRIRELDEDPALRQRLGRNCAEICAYFSYRNIGRSWDVLLRSLQRTAREGD